MKSTQGIPSGADCFAKQFGRELAALRKRSSYSSLEEVVTALQENFPELRRGISRSMISLYERGKILNANPELLKAIAKLYKADPDALLARWVSGRYSLRAPLDESSCVAFAERLTCRLRVSEAGDVSTIGLTALKRFKEEQGALPDGTKVFVVAMAFLDDSVFFETVRSNLLRKITYTYVLPVTEQPAYQAFVRRIEVSSPKLKGKIDSCVTFFVPRAHFDFPCNHVVYVKPDGDLEAYIGLLVGKVPHYFQRTDSETAFRVLQGFRLALSVADDPELKRRMSQVQHELENEKVSSETSETSNRSSGKTRR